MYICHARNVAAVFQWFRGFAGIVALIAGGSLLGTAGESSLTSQLASEFEANGLSIISVMNKNWTAFAFGLDRYVRGDFTPFLYAARISTDGKTIAGSSDRGELVRVTLDGKTTSSCQLYITAWSVSMSSRQSKAVVIGRRYVPGHKEDTVAQGVFYVSHLSTTDTTCRAIIDQLPIESTEEDLHTGVSWSPDEKAFTYTIGGRVFTYNVDRHKADFIAEGGAGRWSPDGKWISFRGPHGEAWLIDPTTGQRRGILPGRVIRAALHWSPDSRFLFFSEVVPASDRFTHPFSSARFVVYRMSDGATVPVFWVANPISDSFYDWGYVPEAVRDRE